MADLTKVVDAVYKGRLKEIQGLVQEALDAGAEPTAVLDEALVKGMDVVTQKWKEGQVFVPEVLRSAKTMQSGMDVLKVRRQYGQQLGIIGGLDKRVLAKGGQVMRDEVDRVMPLVEDGGYIPELDHSVPPDVSWADFCDFIGYLKHRLGRG